MFQPNIVTQLLCRDFAETFTTESTYWVHEGKQKNVSLVTKINHMCQQPGPDAKVSQLAVMQLESYDRFSETFGKKNRLFPAADAIRFHASGFTGHLSQNENFRKLPLTYESGNSELGHPRVWSGLPALCCGGDRLPAKRS